MSNSKAPTNAFSPTNQPTPGNTRGKSPKTKALAALQRVNGWSEDDLYDHIATEAFQKNNKDMLKAFLDAAVPTARTTLPNISFQYDRNAPYHEKAEVVMDAMSKGEIPPDVALDIINSIKHIATVHEQHELMKRIEQLEKLLAQPKNPYTQQAVDARYVPTDLDQLNAVWDTTGSGSKFGGSAYSK